MKKRGTIIKEKEKERSRERISHEKQLLSKSAEEPSDLLSRDRIGAAPLSPPVGRPERVTLSKSMGEATGTKLLRSATKTREMPEAHRLAKAGDAEGLVRLVQEQGRAAVLRTLDWRGQSVLHIAIDQNNRALTQRLIDLYPVDQLEADLNLRDNNGWSPVHVAAGTIPATAPPNSRPTHVLVNTHTTHTTHDSVGECGDAAAPPVEQSVRRDGGVVRWVHSAPLLHPILPRRTVVPCGGLHGRAGGRWRRQRHQSGRPILLRRPATHHEGYRPTNPPPPIHPQ